MDIIVPIVVFIIFCILFSICGWCCRKNRQGTVYQYNGTPIQITSNVQPAVPPGMPQVTSLPYPVEPGHPIPITATSNIGFIEEIQYPVSRTPPYPVEPAHRTSSPLICYERFHRPVSPLPYPTEDRSPHGNWKSSSAPGYSYSYVPPPAGIGQPVMPGYQTAPYPPVNPMQPYPGAAPYPPGAAPYPPGAAPYPPAGASPYPPATGAPYPTGTSAPYPPAAPYPAGAAAPPPSYSEAVSVPPNPPIVTEQYGKQSPYNPNY